MAKQRKWIHLWGNTFIPKMNLLIVVGILIALFFSYSFIIESVLSFILMLIMVAIFVVIARKEGIEH
jgi:type III secretory pathway component EscS